MFGKSNSKPTVEVRPVKPAMSNIPSIIAQGFSVKGNITCDGDIQLDGTVEGALQTKSLTIGVSGEVRGEVTAQRVRVLGRVVGPIRAGAVELGRTARVIGDIRYETLTVEPEAQVDGHLQRIEDAGAAIEALVPAGLALVHDVAKVGEGAKK
jgi:cytoskeletal protein CcmA (bactofilin family)